MIFQSRTALEIWVPLFLAAARVYALNSLPRISRLVFLSAFHPVDMLHDPVDYPGALCTVHPAWPARCVPLLPAPKAVDMFDPGFNDLSTCLIQSAGSNIQSTGCCCSFGGCIAWMVFGNSIFLLQFCMFLHDFHHLT